jgi:hypothetical protein
MVAQPLRPVSLIHQSPERTFRPFHGVGLKRINVVASQASEVGSAVLRYDGFHSLVAMRATRGIHG